ncbi:hypothetical protein BC332_33890 [Capsicum chinense]|nr:hypothetical protein BC332_33890 [Capsicum chinense]
MQAYDTPLCRTPRIAIALVHRAAVFWLFCAAAAAAVKFLVFLNLKSVYIKRHLESICLVVVIKKSRRINDVRGSRRPPRCHDKLKQVTFGGFYGTVLEMRLALYVLKTAPALEKMFISPRYKNYFSSAPQTKLNLSFVAAKRNSIQQKLHGRAISRKAVVIVQ